MHACPVILAPGRSVFIALLLLPFLSACQNNPTDHPYRVDSALSVSDPQFARTIGNLLGPSLVPGNSTTTLVNGDQIFPAMLDAIRSATRSINFETYVYWSGKIGSDFAAALSERAAHGVQVHVIIDSVGSDRIAKKYIQQMTKAGVHLVKYHPLAWYNVTAAQKLDNRTHRKLLIIDGKTGFIGGAGIADEWLGDACCPCQWRDTHYKLLGPAVAQLQAAFMDNWMEATGQVMDGPDYFPALKESGPQAAQVFKSSPNGGSESMELMFLMSISAARKNIRLASAYFVPDQLTIDALTQARQRGVKVQIIVPGPHIDEKIVRRASRARWGDLLKTGVEIFEYQPTMYHCKQMIIDDRWVSIGSANLDNRSFRLNDEANLNILDPTFAAEQIALFEKDLAKSKSISSEQWRHRPEHEKFMESFTTLFGFLM